MKLNGKKDVRRVAKGKSYPSFFIIFQVFKVIPRFLAIFFSILRKKSTAQGIGYSSSQDTKKSYKKGRFKVSPYKKQKAGNFINFRGISNFIAIISIILTGSTVFYFQQVSSKLLDKKQSVINLYERYQSIHHLNNRTKTLLDTMQTYKGTSGELYMLMDKEQSIAKEEARVLEIYRNSLVDGKNISMDIPLDIPFSLLLALGVLFLCLVVRFYLLIKERRKVLFYESRM